jgi:diadenosine tetraphosphate (Ap4A) HIT family hydrolase
MPVTAHWPSNWAEMLAGADCVMCPALGKGDNDYVVCVGAGRFAEVHVERRSRLRGYCMVVWRHGHVSDPADLDPQDAAGYWSEILDVGRAVRAVFSPVKINYLTLGNITPHLHTHVIPRYLDDPAPGGPLPWPELFVDEPTEEAQLQRDAAALRAQLGW